MQIKWCATIINITNKTRKIRADTSMRKKAMAEKNKHKKKNRKKRKQ